MTEHCPQDGGFIGDAGCTHPNHEHSPLVTGIIERSAAKGYKPDFVSELEAEAALEEGFYVNGPNGKRIGFGKSLLRHFNEDHDLSDPDVEAKIADRKRRLMFAINTVMRPNRSESNHRSIPGRTAYFKSFDGFGIQAITSKDGDRDMIEYVFTYFTDDKLAKNRKGRAGCPSREVTATGSRTVSQAFPCATLPPRSPKATCTCHVPNGDDGNDTTSEPAAQGAKESFTQKGNPE